MAAVSSNVQVLLPRLKHEKARYNQRAFGRIYLLSGFFRERRIFTLHKYHKVIIQL